METTLSAQQLTTSEQLKLSRTFDFNLEALRGFAAILVVWHHVIEHKYWLDPHYSPKGLFSFNPAGHLSVLVFFVLSGYVIGHVHIKPLAQKDIIPYIKKRFLRIYPIYFICIVAGLLVARTAYPALTIFCNLTLTQNELAPTIFENNPAWSLNFEILFYLLFIPLSYFRLNISFVTIIFAVAGIVANTQGYYQTAGYALGFAFWLCGVFIARNAQRPIPPSFALMVSMLLLLLSLRKFNSLTLWFNKLDFLLANPSAFESGPVQISDLSNLPYCILLVLVFASRNFPYRSYILPTLLLIPMYAFCKRLHDTGLVQNKGLIPPTIFYILAIILFFRPQLIEQHCKRFIQRLSSTGAWSYGLYLIHFPILAVFVRIDTFSGTAAAFSIRLLVYIFLCFAAAYFLEKKYQPWVKRFFVKQ